MGHAQDSTIAYKRGQPIPLSMVGCWNGRQATPQEASFFTRKGSSSPINYQSILYLSIHGEKAQHEKGPCNPATNEKTPYYNKAHKEKVKETT